MLVRLEYIREKLLYSAERALKLIYLKLIEKKAIISNIFEEIPCCILSNNSALHQLLKSPLGCRSYIFVQLPQILFFMFNLIELITRLQLLAVVIT
jgi:hypothetical protein